MAFLISISLLSPGYISLVSADKLANLERWYNVDVLKDLAFDHKEMIRKARQYLKDNISSLIVKQFMPRLFPLNKLQEVYEIIEDKKYDNRNFRKGMISSGLVEETKKREEGVSHRPARLFRFSKL